MKGKILTQAGDPVQVIGVADSDGVQVAVVAYRGKEATILYSDVTECYPHNTSADAVRQIREAAHAALQERDSQFLRLMISRFRATVFSASGVIPGTGQPVLSPSGRRMSFEFRHRMLETGTDSYRVTIRRLRRPRPEG